MFSLRLIAPLLPLYSSVCQHLLNISLNVSIKFFVLLRPKQTSDWQLISPHNAAVWTRYSQIGEMNGRRSRVKATESL